MVTFRLAVTSSSTRVLFSSKFMMDSITDTADEIDFQGDDNGFTASFSLNDSEVIVDCIYRIFFDFHDHYLNIRYHFNILMHSRSQRIWG